MTTQPVTHAAGETLWSEICAQREGAFERLEVLVKEVCSVVFRPSVVPSAERERLLQDVLVSVWEFAGKQNEQPRNLRAFLQWRARGVLSTFRRELQARDRQSPMEVDIPIPGGGTRQLDEVLMREMNASFEACRERLSPIYAAVWGARFERDLDPRATAAELGIDVSAVAVRLHRAKDLLMECLKRSGVLQ